MRSQDHYLPLMLNGKLKMALIKLQAEKELGQSFAGLLALVEGLHALKHLSDEDYLIYRKRYSQKLVDEPQQKLIPEVNMQALKEIQNMTKTFSLVLDQWSMHPNREWRAKWISKAKEYENRVPNARFILDLAMEDANK